MPRTARASVGGVCYHVLNRGNGRAEVFHKDGDYASFLQLMAEANERLPMRILAYALLPNHFHLVLWPRGDGDQSRWMQWLLTSHVRRYHRHYHGSGHVWQGRFKAFHPTRRTSPDRVALCGTQSAARPSRTPGRELGVVESGLAGRRPASGPVIELADPLSAQLARAGQLGADERRSGSRAAEHRPRHPLRR